MKRIIIIGILVLVSLSCKFTSGGKPDTEKMDLQPRVMTNDISKINEQDLQRAIKTVDTTINKFHITYSLIESKDTITKSGVDWKGTNLSLKYADRNIILDLMVDNTKVLSKERISKTNFSSIIPANEINKYQLWNCRIRTVADDGVHFFINVCIPDTDICYPIDMLINADGKIIYTLIAD